MRGRPSVAAIALLALLVALVVGTTSCAGGFGQGGASWQAARLYTSGTAALDRGEEVLAVSELESAVALAPEASEIRNHLGLAYAAVGRPEAARSSFEEALRLDCRNEAARSNLAWVRAQAAGAAETPLVHVRARHSVERP